MKMNMYSILDTKLGAFQGIFLDLTHDSAIRTFSDWVNEANPANKFNKHPEDFALYCVGAFHQVSGEIIPVDKLTALITASAAKTLTTTADLDMRDRSLNGVNLQGV